jgi:hypothetical protein
MRRVFLPLGILVLVFSAGCLNYTTEEGAEHHREFAVKHGLPEPSHGIYVMGLVCTAVGAGLSGFALGRPRRTE